MGFYWTPKVSGFYDWSTQLVLLGKSTHACVFKKMKPSSFLKNKGESEAYKKKSHPSGCCCCCPAYCHHFLLGGVGKDQKDVDFKGYDDVVDI